MADKEELGVWHAEQDILYLLEPGEMWDKGKLLPRNRFTVHVMRCHKSVSAEERQKLQDDIHEFLKQRATA
jgi:hypothetical protein